jgi:hypothetical protein
MGDADPRLGNGLSRNRRCRPMYPSASHRLTVALRDRLLHPGNHSDNLFTFTRQNILQLGFYVNMRAATCLFVIDRCRVAAFALGPGRICAQPPTELGSLAARRLAL